MPLAIAVLVVVLDAALTVADPDPSRFSVEPVLVKLSPLGPSAVLSCATTEAMPSEKLTPTLSGLAPGPFCNGSASGSVTLTIEIWCWVLVAVSV